MQSKNKKKEAILKQCLSIDVSKDKLDACFSKMCDDQSCKIQGTHGFLNTRSGWKALAEWAKRFRKDEQIPFCVVMEATGVYHEGLAYHLKDAGFPVSIVLPNKSKNFAKSLNLKTKTDGVDAQMLGRMGLERKLELWCGPSGTLLKLKKLTREREALMEHRTAVMNQLHANKFEYQVDRKTIKRRQQLIAYLEKQAKAVEKQVLEVLALDPELQAKVANVCTIKGVRTLTAVTVIAEANGFDLIENKGQLVSYVGYDVVERQSGSSLKGRTRISKKGNSHIRKALFFPALTAAQHDPKMKSLYERILEKNPKVKMIGAVAVQKKLLVIIYTLYKNNVKYDPNYGQTKAAA